MLFCTCEIPLTFFCRLVVIWELKGPVAGRTVGAGGGQRPGGQPVLGSPSPLPFSQALQRAWLSRLSACFFGQ